MMRFQNPRLRVAFGLALMIALAPCVRAQEFRGQLIGTGTDKSGAVLPGVTVTARSPALIQPQVQVTGADGTYRLIALPAGVYELTFELTGFQTVKHENIRVMINQTLTVNAELDVASVQESVTVTGASPVVDTSTTKVGTNFTKELLTEIPNARDVWAALSQAPGFQMTGYDVGGSHTGTQTGFMSYGIDDQRTTRLEGVNVTEDTGANAGYFDFGSFEEMQLGAAGNDAGQDTPGSSMNITVKSGGDRFSGTYYNDWEGKGLISDNVPKAFKTAFARDSNGFFVRKPLDRGNPIDRQYDINANVGGPIKKGRAWFFYSYRLNNQYKFVLNPDGSVFNTLAQSKLTNLYTLKGTFQLSKGNQLIGYMNKREKLQALRDFGPDVPVSAAYYQPSRNYPMKVEWTSVLSDRTFLDVLVGQWYNFFPLRPTTESGAFAGTYVPGRVDISTSTRFDGGPNTLYQNQRRFKPQFSASVSYFKDGWRGSHNFKFGSEGRRERRYFLADQPFNLVYYDKVLGVTPQEVEFYNTPNDSANEVKALAGYINDSWRLNNRLTLSLGFRVDHYVDGWLEQVVEPGGVPQLAGTTDQRLINLWARKVIPATTVDRHTTFGPRAGFAYDFRGNAKSVVKGFYGRFYFNSSPDAVAAQANPVGRTRLRYSWTDSNSNLVIDGPHELGSFIRTVAGPSGVTIDPNLKRPYGDELSGHFEQEIIEGLSGRASYIYKNLRDEWAIVDLNRVSAYTVPFSARDPGPTGVFGTSDGPNIPLLDLSASLPENRVFTNPKDPSYDSDYHTIEVALNRRFKDNWMLLTSFEHTWLKQFHNNTSTTSQLGAAGNTKDFDWRPNIQRFGRETSTLWNYKILGRYTAPFEIGLSGSYKLQSGRNWGRSLAVTLPVARSETIRVEPVTANRAPNVGIFDVRFDKSFRVRAGHFSNRLVLMADVFNLTNASTVTTFRTATASNGSFKEVTALLDPRIIRLGLRWEF